MAPRFSQLFLERVTIPFDDIDAGGVLYHANYLKHCDRARNTVLASTGWNWQRMVAERCVLAVVHVDAEYRRAAMQGPVWMATRFSFESDRFLMAAHAMIPGELTREEVVAKVDIPNLTLERARGVHFRAMFKLVPIALGEFTPASLPQDLLASLFAGGLQ
jgi:YbgC/YbaW family acyl-CoA thioester hydrolase